MKKVLGLLFVCFIAFGASLAVASTRTDSMNVDSRLVEDMDLIWLYPNKVTEYKNTVDYRLPLGATNNQWGGFLDGEHADMGVVGAYVFRPFTFNGTDNRITGTSLWRGVGGTVGFGNSWNVFNEGYFAFGNAWGGSGGANRLNASTPENKVDIFWGNTFDKTSFGVQLNYADAINGGAGNTLGSDDGAAVPFKTVTTSNDSRVFGINLGLGLQDAGPFNQANFHLGYYMGSIAASLVTVPNTGFALVNDSLKDNGISTITLGLLLQHNLDDNSSLRVYGDAYIDQNNQTMVESNDSTGDGLHNNAADVDETWTGKYNDILAQIGLGCNHKVLDGKATISSGLQATWGNSDIKATGSTQDGNTAVVTTVGFPVDDYIQDFWRLTWNASVEAKAASWLTIRAGINRPIIARYTQVSTNNYPVPATNIAKGTSTLDTYFGNNTATYTMGFGVNWENWVLDASTSVASIQNSLTNVNPGNGLLINKGTNIVTNTEFDLRFKF